MRSQLHPTTASSQARHSDHRIVAGSVTMTPVEAALAARLVFIRPKGGGAEVEQPHVEQHRVEERGVLALSRCFVAGLLKKGGFRHVVSPLSLGDSYANLAHLVKTIWRNRSNYFCTTISAVVLNENEG